MAGRVEAPLVTVKRMTKRPASCAILPFIVGSRFIGPENFVTHDALGKCDSKFHPRHLIYFAHLPPSSFPFSPAMISPPYAFFVISTN